MTIRFDDTYIENYYSLIGRNEHNITIKADEMLNSYYTDQRSVEQTESNFQVRTIKGLLKKSKLKEENVDLVVAGDLQNQIFASSFAMRNFNIPFIGHYSACASFTGGALIASSMIKNFEIKNAIVTVSAHNLASEKQFRFPIEYGAIRKRVNTFTATGSVSVLISHNKSNIKVESATIGKVVDLGYKDANNFGACMAPSAAKTLYEHLKDTKRKATYYDLILTGDLGIYGLEILKEYMKKEYKLNIENILDAGALLFKDSGNNIAGGSGPVCLPLILFNKIIKEKYKKVLLIGTGSLHSKNSCNFNESIPSISHAISLEVIDL